jgi:CheY-like chemotaxis protein
MQQVFLNIANNAFDAMRPLGRGTLRIAAEVDGDFVTVYCDDDGPGIMRPDRIFEPFYTTKPVGTGTGLGLALAHQYVTEVGGSVRAENRADGGARFVVRLPLAPPETQPAPGLAARTATALPAPAERVTTAGGHPARILVVDDEATLRRLQARLLERIDASVFVAADVDEAEAVIRSRELDLIISDIKMPGEKNGLDLFAWIQRERPELAARFLFVTGDVTDTDIARVAAQYPNQVVRKPFLVNEYLAQVALLLG